MMDLLGIHHEEKDVDIQDQMTLERFRKPS